MTSGRGVRESETADQRIRGRERTCRSAERWERPRDRASAKCRRSEKERASDSARGSEQEEGERRTLLPVERESNVEKEEVGPRARDEENER